MSKRGERPYAQFDFLIALGDGDPESEPVAGFRECSNVGMEVTVAEYRRAGSREAAARALEKHGEAGEATLKDGMLRQSVLRAWLRDQASAEHGRTALVSRRTADGAEPLLTFRLMGARITTHVSGPFNAKGTDVTMEELTLAYERIEAEF